MTQEHLKEAAERMRRARLANPVTSKARARELFKMHDQARRSSRLALNVGADTGRQDPQSSCGGQ
jgi:hypothetical protein